VKILLVEDDPLLARKLERVLSQNGYVVDTAADGQEGYDLVEAFEYDLIVSDVRLPKLDGINLCKQLRQQGKQMPIMLLTGDEASDRKVSGLDAGADDYLVKPVEVEEFLARVRALLRRGGTALLAVLEWRGLRMDETSCVVTYTDRLVPLTRKEYSLLELFLRNTRRIYSQSALLDLLWSFEEPPTENTVRAHIKSLRQKLKKAGAPADFIETVYGLGYRLKHSPSDDLPASEEPPAPTTASQGTAGVQLNPDYADIWLDSRDIVEERVNILVTAIAALAEGALSSEQRQAADRAAHTLVGSLGAVGLLEGVRLARHIKQTLQETLEPGPEPLASLQENISQLSQTIQQTFTTDLPASSVQAASFSPEGIEKQSLLLVVDDDTALAQMVKLEATAGGMRVDIASSIAAARASMQREQPDAILLDLGFPDPAESGFTLLEELAEARPTIPVVVFTARDDFAARVKVARMGGQGFLQKPIRPRQVLETLSQVLQRSTASAARVMVVDDEPQVLDEIRIMLEPWGVNLMLLEDTGHFWQVLGQFQPELLILAVEMPQLTGIDLCQVVRNDPQWGDLPILFLATQTDAAAIYRLFEAGGSDYVSKPIAEPELVARVLTHMERSPARRNLDGIDPLLGVMHRTRFTQELTRLLHLTQRHQLSLCLVVVSVRGWPDLIARHGRSSGDRVLRQLGDRLQAIAQPGDILARWDDSTVVLSGYGCLKAQMQTDVATAIAELEDFEFTSADDRPFRINCACGVAQYPQDGEDIYSLYRQASAALESQREGEKPRRRRPLYRLTE
jgi:diguanylate cyclase (GGDEF)-like protein